MAILKGRNATVFVARGDTNKGVGLSPNQQHVFFEQLLCQRVRYT